MQKHKNTYERHENRQQDKKKANQKWRQMGETQ